jgi:hypothetical protein
MMSFLNSNIFATNFHYITSPLPSKTTILLLATSSFTFSSQLLPLPSLYAIKAPSSSSSSSLRLITPSTFITLLPPPNFLSQAPQPHVKVTLSLSWMAIIDQGHLGRSLSNLFSGAPSSINYKKQPALGWAHLAVDFFSSLSSCL